MVPGNTCVTEPLSSIGFYFVTDLPNDTPAGYSGGCVEIKSILSIMFTHESHDTIEWIRSRGFCKTGLTGRFDNMHRSRREDFNNFRKGAALGIRNDRLASIKCDGGFQVELVLHECIRLDTEK